MYKIYKIIASNKKGFSLIELVVATALFTAAMLMATGIFNSVLEGQRSAVAAQNIQESMKFAFEVMSKEIRMARGLHGGSRCYDNNPANLDGHGYYKVFNTEYEAGHPSPDIGSILYFENKDNNCVRYYLENDTNNVSRLKVDRDDGVSVVSGYITPDDIEVTDLEFSIVDDKADDFHGVQPKVTMKMKVKTTGGKGINKQTIYLQTTISSRRYE